MNNKGDLMNGEQRKEYEAKCKAIKDRKISKNEQDLAIIGVMRAYEILEPLKYKPLLPFKKDIK